jgi:broad specificity phosphatase PhoE
MTTFLLIRHATNNTVGKRLAGRMACVSLNEEGIQQAQQLALRLQSVQIDCVYSSPLERAVETAAPIASLQHVETITSNDFIEIQFGDWTNSTFDSLKDDDTFKRFNSFRSCTRVPGGETMLEAQLRIVSGIQKLHAAQPGKTLAIVSHADVIKSAVLYFTGMPLDLFQRIEISPASVTILQLDDYAARLLLLNHTGHITF